MAVTTLPQKIVRGDLRFQTTNPSVDGGLILGERLAERFGIQVGDVVTLIPPKPPKVNAALGIAVPRLWQYEVTGIFNTGMFQYDNQFVVMSLPAAQQFTGMGSAVSGIEIRLRDPDMAPAVGVRLVEKLGYPFRYLDWQSQNSGLFSALQLEKIAMGLVIFFIMIVAAFNIVGTLTMVVTDKTREIGILQAMGVTGRSIGKIFLLQGALIGAVGTFTGLAIGLLIAFIVDQSGWVRIDPSVYFIDRLPVHVQLLDVLVVIVASFLLALVATWFPARGAARLTPVEAIRHE
jgi:lipoprotein-releasing system permease protein